MPNGLPVNQIVEGDCLEVMRGWPDQCVHCVVTSPPYWGLRDYEIEPSIWGEDAGCEHEWGDELVNKIHRKPHNGLSNAADAAAPRKNPRNANRAEDGSIDFGSRRGQWCRKCGAWRGCYGLEPTPTLFVEHTVTIFREVRRVLRDDGTLWLNIGDSYTSCGRNTHGTRIGYKQGSNAGCLGVTELRPELPVGLKPKDLVGIPWRVAFALQADGWYLRQDIIWHKPNPMPESVNDRCTKAHEYLFLLSKSPRYFYDAEPVKEPSVTREASVAEYAKMLKETGERWYPRVGSDTDHTGGKHGKKFAGFAPPGGRNKRSVWSIATAPFKEAHFATFPPELVRPCIRAGTSAKGCCPECGAPWEPVLNKVRVATRPGLAGKVYVEPPVHPGSPVRQHHGTVCGNRDPGRHVTESKTIGWRPTCKCGCSASLRPCVVLDPFGGSGTTGMVAAQEHRDYVMIERNPKYVEMARNTRLAAVETGVPSTESKAGQLPLFGSVTSVSLW